jgi:hypothetical protein
MTKYEIPNCLYFDLTEWIKEDDMTEKEKEDHPEYKTNGGYFKEIPYKDAARKSISNASERDKELIRVLPNYDPDVFEKIFGIRI